MKSINISIVVPVYNEENNLKILLKEIQNSTEEFNNKEIIFINDCSTDKSYEVLKTFEKKNHIKIINNPKNLGQSYSIYIGIKNSKYQNIITLDADLQNNPSDIKKISEKYFSENYALVGGIRTKRKDKFNKIISSKIANYVRMKILRDDCKDTGCSLKIFNKNIFLGFDYFDGIHRFIPALFSGYGHKTTFITVDHRPRLYGVSKYNNFNRLVKGIRDLFRVYKIIKNFQKDI